MMEVILLERIERLGQMGDVVRVKPGYARNFLLPRKKALRKTKDNLAYFESRRTELEATNLKRRGEAEAVAKKADGMQVVLVRQASDTGQLYGSVRPRDVADAINAEGVKIESNQVKLDIPIKTLGLHKLRVALHPEVSISITVNVARSAEEAKLQAEGKSISAAAEEEETAVTDVFEPGAAPAEPTGETSETGETPASAS
jgi:large subunit ribosomal protein L9